MIEAPDFLPLGSVVSLEGNDKKLMIIGRALVVQNEDGGKEYFDYGFCLYPDGLIGDAVIYSNHDCINEIYQEGYSDESNIEMVETIKKALPDLDISKANPKPISRW